jgi:hypothetical protein
MKPSLRTMIFMKVLSFFENVFQSHRDDIIVETE